MAAGTRSLENITLQAVLKATLKNTGDGSIPFSGVLGKTAKPATAFTSGTAAGKADRIWNSPGRTLAQNASETIDVYDFGSLDIGGGAGRDLAGQLLTLAEIVGILIHNLSTSVGNLLIGGEGTAAAWNSPFNGSDTAVLGPLPPGGVFPLWTPSDPAFVVTDVSNHLLKIAENNVGAVTYDIVILGRSA